MQLHKIQALILRELQLKQKKKFHELNITSLENNHFNFHLKQLLKNGLIKKKNSFYDLTSKGRLFVLDLDIFNLKITKQGKRSVLLIVTKSVKNEIFYLMHKRTKEPFYGKLGFCAGKVDEFETIEECAKRELFEETNLVATNTKLLGITHSITLNSENKGLDVYYYRVQILGFRGKLKNSIEGENYWMKAEAVYEEIDKGNSYRGFKNSFTNYAVKKLEGFEEHIDIANEDFLVK